GAKRTRTSEFMARYDTHKSGSCRIPANNTPNLRLMTGPTTNIPPPEETILKQRAQLRRGWSTCWQLKECQADENGRADADQVHKEHGAQGVSRVLDLHAPEINGDDIEGGLGRALENAGEPAGKGVSAVCPHGVEEESAAAG